MAQSAEMAPYFNGAYASCKWRYLKWRHMAYAPYKYDAIWRHIKWRHFKWRYPQLLCVFFGQNFSKKSLKIVIFCYDLFGIKQHAYAQ